MIAVPFNKMAPVVFTKRRIVSPTDKTKSAWKQSPGKKQSSYYRDMSFIIKLGLTAYGDRDILSILSMFINRLQGQLNNKENGKFFSLID